MKLRMEGNSIRLRLKKSDIEKLKKEGIVGETVAFSDNLYFYYKLKTNQHDQEINATFVHSSVQITLPLPLATTWMDTDQVGIHFTLDSGLTILIEKDFPCKTRDDENKEDTFQELAQHNC
jgi:hypothetical protein